MSVDKDMEKEDLEEINDFEEDDLKEKENLEEKFKQDNSCEKKEDEKLDNQEESYKKKFEDMEDSFLRLQADFSNFKKRNEKERSKLINLGVENVVLEILPVLDNFQRALETKTEDQVFYEGIKMIENQFIELLENLEVKEIDALNQAFDPNYHYAVKMQESDEHDSNTVMMVLQKGYMLKDKVIRPAMVIVAE